MAQGYISSRGILEVEDVGDQICNDLVLRSLLQYDPRISRDGRIMMHDLVHDLAQSIMENKVPWVRVERQVSSTSNCNNIRQVNLKPSTQHDMDISSILTKFSRLRVLNANSGRIKDLPSTVGNLKHLRFLNLSGSEILTLPNSLCNLWNLQILNLDRCQLLVALPRNMRYLKNLRHLCLEHCISLREMPSKLGELTCLKTLNLYIVGNNRGNQLEELQSLNLGGSLGIRNLERVESYMDAKKANLSEKKDLHHLRFEWESCSSTAESRTNVDEKVLEALQPHPNLQTLTITGFSGRCFPVWMTVSILKNLVRMEIVDCRHCLHLPQLGKLPHLEVLTMEDVEVEYIIEDENVVDTLFPSLKLLELWSLPNLKSLLKKQANTQVFPNLRNLTIHSCSSLVLAGPELSSLQDLTMWNCVGLTSTSFAKPNALTNLTVGFGGRTKSFPMGTLQKLSNLKTLMVEAVEEESLPEEGLRALKSLTRFVVASSETLRCLPVGWLRHLTALKFLGIHNCTELVELPEEIKELENLETLELFRVDKMVCLPKAVCHISSLKHLSINILHQLDSLPHWLEELTSLQTLYIHSCPKLASLPASIRGMSNLQSLTISQCPEVQRRCKRGSGEDWHYISHIPQLIIGRH